MKRFAVLLTLCCLCACLTGCGNKRLGFGNYTFTHAHISDGVNGYCAEVSGWHEDEIGIEIKTPGGTYYLSEGTYQLFESESSCPYCKGE